MNVVKRRLWDVRALWLRTRRVILRGDQAGWVLDDVTAALAAYLPGECRPGISRGPDTHFLHRRIVHFLGQFDVFGKDHTHGVPPDNRLVATWWHGCATSEDEALRHAFAAVPAWSKRLDRIVVSCGIYEDALRRAGVAEEKLIRLPLGVDDERFRPASPSERSAARRKLGIDEETFCIGSFQKDGVGWDDGMEPKRIKGPDVLLQVAEELKSADVHFLLAGPARGYVAAGLSELGVPHTGLGFIPGEDVPAFYRALDAYLIPAREEGGPAALLEAMASRVPVVSTRVGMAPDVIADDRDGLLADVQDAQALAAHLRVLMQDRAQCAAMADAAREKSMTYEWASVARQYAERLYLPLMEAK